MTEGATHGPMRSRQRETRWRLLTEIDRLAQRPLIVLSFIWLGLLMLDLLGRGTQATGALALVIWAIFIAQFALELVIAPDRRAYLRSHWLTAVSLVLPAVRILRVVPALRILGAARAVRSVSLLRVLTSTNRGLAALRSTLAKGGFAYSEIHPDELGVTCAGFLSRAAAWFASLGVRIERVMTDNARNYVDSRAFQAALDDIGARHVRTRAYRPQTNGKVERFHGTLLREWAYVRLYASNDERAAALPDFLAHYNHDRPHTALGGLTPMASLVNNVFVNHT